MNEWWMNDGFTCAHKLQIARIHILTKMSMKTKLARSFVVDISIALVCACKKLACTAA
jgi:hypothetical protein